MSKKNDKLLRSKKAKYSRRKGKNAEYEVRDIVQAVLYPKNEGKVSRTPMSGAWNKLTATTGDLILTINGEPDTRIPIYWEIKVRKKGTIDGLKVMAGHTGVISQWLKKAKKECEQPRIPVVIWKVDRSSWFASLYGRDVTLLAARSAHTGEDNEKQLPFVSLIVYPKALQERIETGGIVTFPLSVFLTLVSGFMKGVSNEKDQEE